MKATQVVAIAVIALLVGGSHARHIQTVDAQQHSRHLSQQLAVVDAITVPAAGLLGILKIVANLVSSISAVGPVSQIEDALDEDALASFLKTTLATLGVSNAAINQIVQGPGLDKVVDEKLLDATVRGVAEGLQILTSTGSVSQTLVPILKALGDNIPSNTIIPGLKQILDFDVIFKGLGLPLDGATLNKVVDLDKVNGLVISLVTSIANGYISGGLALPNLPTLPSSDSATEAAKPAFDVLSMLLGR